MGQTILITESQYSRIFLKENFFKGFLNEQSTPKANAGDIQKFLKDLGYYKGEVDWDFGDSSAEAFAKYYGGASLGWVKTLRQLYDELKVMRFPVGNKFGFGPKMAKVISDLIEKKESEKTKITPNSLRNMGEWPYLSVLKKLNVSEKEVEACKPCTKPLTDDEILEFWLGPKKPEKSMKLFDPKTMPSCMACHKFVGPNALTQKDDPEGFNYFQMMMNSTNQLDDFIYKYRHEIIDVLAVAALFIPVPGLNIAISLGLEGINAGLYFSEEDNTMGWLSLAFMLIPAVGPVLRRITGTGVKKVHKIITTGNKMAKNGKSSSEVYEYVAKNVDNLTPDEKELLDLTLENVDKFDKYLNMSKKQFQREVKKDFTEWSVKNATKQYGFKKGSKFFQEMFNPTLFERYVIAGFALGLLTLEKTGGLAIITGGVMKLLVKGGLIDQPLTDEEIAVVEEGMIEGIDLSKYDLDSVNVEIRDGNNILTIPEQDQEKILSSIEDRVKVYVDTLNTLPPSPTRVDVLKLPLDKQKSIVKKLKSEGITFDKKLRNFRVYKWAELCSKKTNKDNITVDVVDDEKEEWLNDRMLNYRYIKSDKLGSKYEYAADENGFWYYKLLEDNSTWKPVTNCGALLKIETLLEKQNDPDIDTEEEVQDELDQLLKY